MNVLDELVAQARVSVATRAERVSLESLVRAGEQRLAGPRPFRSFRDAVAAPGVSLIAEHKRSSPSAGVIRADLELRDVVGAYERGGARALSILTEESRFSGRLEDLGDARAATSLPILRKDFVVGEYQVYEALAAGADAILLIVAALDRFTLKRLYTLARSLGLAALVEVHAGVELDAARELGAEVVGINNRDLTTFVVDVGHTLRLLPDVPDGALVVAESGYSSAEDLERLDQAGVDAVLIGEALMRAEDPAAATRRLTGTRV